MPVSRPPSIHDTWRRRQASTHPKGVNSQIDWWGHQTLGVSARAYTPQETEAGVNPPAVVPSDIAAGRFIRWRYPALASAVGAILVVQTLNQQWSHDVWEHLAVIRELAERPLSPRHPILAASDAPHAFVSPYTLALGLLVRWTGADAVTVLAAAGIANLALFLVALRAFVRTVVVNPLAPTWALLFALFAWGVLPWRFSGFVGMNAIGFGLPYPSMFALNVALLSLCALARFGISRQLHWLAWFAGGAVLVVLTHPLTSAGLLIGCIAFAIQYRIPSGGRELAVVGGVLLAAGTLVMLWPGYSLLNLLLHEGDAYDDQVMYVRTVGRIFPALFGAVAIAARSRRQWRDPLGLMLAGALAVYTFGWVTDNWAFGRVIAFGVLILQIGLAAGVADLEREGRLYRSDFPWLSPALVGVVVILGGGLVFTAPAWVRGFPLQFLPSSVEAKMARTPNDVASWQDVLGGGVVASTDPTAEEIAPAIGAKTISSYRPLAFVGDIDERRSAQSTIFAGDLRAARPIIERYGVTHLVTLGPPLENLAQLGTVVPLSEGYYAIILNPT